MTIQFRCGHCSKGYKAPDNWAGKALKCASCGNPLKVPRPASSADSSAASSSQVVKLGDADLDPLAASSSAAASAEPFGDILQLSPSDLAPQNPPSPRQPAATPASAPTSPAANSESELVPILIPKQGMSPVVGLLIGGGVAAVLGALALFLLFGLGTGEPTPVVDAGSNKQPPPTPRGSAGQNSRPSPTNVTPRPPISRPPISRPANPPATSRPTSPVTTTRSSGNTASSGTGRSTGSLPAGTPAPPAVERAPAVEEEPADTGPDPLYPTADVAGWLVRPDTPSGPLALPRKSYSFPFAEGSVVSFGRPPNSFLAITHRKGNLHAHVTYDLAREAVTNVISHPQSLLTPLRICPDGDYIAGRVRGEPKLRVYAMSNGAVTLEQDLREGPSALGFVGPDRLFSIDTPTSGSSEVHIWNLASKSLEKKFPLNGVLNGENAVVSPGHGQLAVVAGTSLQVYDLNSFEKKGELPLPDLARGTADNPNACEGLAYSYDGIELAGLFKASDDKFRLVSWSVSRARPLLDRYYDRKEISTVPGVSKYQGETLEWWPDRGGWLLYGHVLLDRAGEVTLKLPATTNLPRRMVHSDVVMGVGPYNGKLMLGSAELYPEESSQTFASRIPRDRFPTRNLRPAALSTLAPAKNVTLPEYQAPWKLPVVANSTTTTYGTNTIPLGDDYVRALGGAWMASDHPRRAAVLVQRQEENAWQLRQVDLATQRVKQSIPVPEADDPQLLCLSPQGNAALLRSGLRLEIYSFRQGKHVLGWSPYGDRQPGVAATFNPYRTQITARFIDESRVLTLSPQGTLVLWQLPDCSPEWKIDNFGLAFNLSHDRKHVFGGAQGKIVCCDVETGQCVGSLEPLALEPTVLSLGISPDGTRLVGFAQGLPNEWFGAEWDLTSGSRLAQYWLAPAQLASLTRPSYSRYGDYGSTDPIFLPGRNVLFDGSVLVNLDRQVKLCDYNLDRSTLVFGAPPDEVWLAGLVGNFTKYTLGMRKLVLPSTRVLQQTANMTMQNQALLGPGSHVRLEMGGVPEGSSPQVAAGQPERVPLRTLIEQKLVESGFVINPQSPAKISISYSETESGRTIRFQGGAASGGSMAGMTAKAVVSLEYAGQTLVIDVATASNHGLFFHTDDPTSEFNNRMHNAIASRLRQISFPRWFFQSSESLKLPKVSLSVSGGER